MDIPIMGIPNTTIDQNTFMALVMLLDSTSLNVRASERTIKMNKMITTIAFQKIYNCY